MSAEGAARRSVLAEGRSVLAEGRAAGSAISQHARERIGEGKDRIEGRIGQIEERIEQRIEQIPELLPERTVLQRRVRIASAVLLVVCAGLVIAGFASGTLRSLESLQEFVRSIGLLGPVVYVVLVAAQCVFPIIPGGIGIVAGPVLFGPLLGFTYNWIGISLGSFGAFLIARHFGMGIIERIFPASLVQKFHAWTDSPRFTRLFAIAILLPVAPDDLLCYLAGTTKMTFRTYALIIVTCKPWTLAVYSFGLMAALQGIASWLG
ncbi:MAG TPA: TVP38/TMEM64 family protein [Actinomycetales bacterium]|nr:TVP38/TMEM64 family protein [Actinomycetales bacterium]